MKIGIFGGTFNPIHRMHVTVALKALQQVMLDKIIFITSAVPPHKGIGNNAATGSQRHEMVKLAIKDYPQFEASTMELDRHGKSYTYDTLNELKKIYPDDELYFIIGGDSLAYLHEWYRAEDFMKLCTFIVYPRDDDSGQNLIQKCDWLKETYGTKCIILDAVADNISSSQIREAISAGKQIFEYVPKKVAEYIIQNKLYFTQEDT